MVVVNDYSKLWNLPWQGTLFQLVTIVRCIRVLLKTSLIPLPTWRLKETCSQALLDKIKYIQDPLSLTCLLVLIDIYSSHLMWSSLLTCLLVPLDIYPSHLMWSSLLLFDKNTVLVICFKLYRCHAQIVLVSRNLHSSKPKISPTNPFVTLLYFVFP